MNEFWSLVESSIRLTSIGGEFSPPILEASCYNFFAKIAFFLIEVSEMYLIWLSVKVRFRSDFSSYWPYPALIWPGDSAR